MRSHVFRIEVRNWSHFLETRRMALVIVSNQQGSQQLGHSHDLLEAEMLKGHGCNFQWQDAEGVVELRRQLALELAMQLFYHLTPWMTFRQTFQSICVDLECLVWLPIE